MPDVAGLPSEIGSENIDTRMFDLTALKMQLALVESDDRAFESRRQRVVEIAMMLEADQLTARGVMDASALYEPPFSELHAGGPDELFGGRENVIEGIFEKLVAVHSELVAKAG